MTQNTKNQYQKPVPTHPYPPVSINKKKQQAEENEVAGKHKNDGQKDHKGSR